MALRNHNVRLTLAWTVAENLSAALRSGDALSALVFLLARSNAAVGLVQGADGCAQLLAAAPAGWLADHRRRDAVLRAGAALGAAAGAALAWAVATARAAHWWPLAAASAAMGAYRGVYGPSLDALFADSVETGRTSALTWRFVLQLASAAAGPALSIAVFVRLGGAWTLDACRAVCLAGAALMLPALVLQCLFDDGRALGRESEARGAAPPPLLDSAADGGARAAAAPRLRPAAAATLLILASDLLGGLASGMTIKFFSMFFWQELHFSPVAVSALGAATPLAVSAASVGAARAARAGLGRVQTSLLARAVDIALLLAMAALPPPAVAALVAAHVARMAAGNCSRPLLRSVLNENVPKRWRGRVSAVDSIRAFSWSGSAALGGVLVQRLGFQATFRITAAIKLAAALPLLPLLAHVPDGVGAGARRGAAASAAAAGYAVLPDGEGGEGGEGSEGGKDRRAGGAAASPPNA